MYYNRTTFVKGIPETYVVRLTILVWEKNLQPSKLYWIIVRLRGWEKKNVKSLRLGLSRLRRLRKKKPPVIKLC